MTREQPVAGWRRTLPEIALTLMVLAGVANTIHRFMIDGKLPQPFIFDVNDTFMDWFNTAYWAHNPGAFDNWHTVYPPLSFVFLRSLGLHACYGANGLAARDCDFVGVYAICACFLLCAVASWFAFRRAVPQVALWRWLSFTFGLPLLFTFERGNLILPCFVFFALAYGGIIKNRWLRAAAIAVTINFKPYLLIAAIGLAWQRRWRDLELAGLATVGLYLLTYAMFGDGSPMQLAADVAIWVQMTSGQLYEGIYYSTSYTSFLAFDTPHFPTRDFVPSQVVDWILFLVPIVVRTSQAVGLLSLIGAWLQPRAVTAQRVSLLLLTIALVGNSPGGYTEVFLLFLLFLEQSARPGIKIALAMGYLLSIPYDYVFSTLLTIQAEAWLSGRPVTAPFGFAVGIFARPGLIVAMLWALSLDTLGQVVRAHRAQRPTLDPHPRAMLARAVKS